MHRTLPALSHRLPVAIFGVLALQPAVLAAAHHRQPLILTGFLGAVLLAWWRPLPAFVLGGVGLRLLFLDSCCGDQIIVSHAAWERVSAGLGGPYGVGYPETIPPGSPFPYGPLGLVWWLPGSVVEFAASVGIMGGLAWQRAPLTLAAFAGWLPAVIITWAGVNDYSPALLILGALLIMRSRPLLGAVLLAVAAALKPYALAWFAPAIGFGGATAALVLLGLSAVLWSPLLWWGGPAAFLESVRMTDRVTSAGNALEPLRWLAVPLALTGLLARRWEVMVLVGAATFALFLGPTRGMLTNYWVALLPIAGLGVEEVIRNRAHYRVEWRRMVPCA